MMIPQVKKLDLEIKSLSSATKTKDKRKRASLKKELEELISKHLIATNPDFTIKYKENQDLLAKSHLNFKVVHNGSSPFETSTTAMKGKLDKNGYAYLSPDYENEKWFSSVRCPKVFNGNINALGRITLKAKTKWFEVFNSHLEEVPESYSGSIDSHGNITLVLKKSKFSLNRNKYINKMMCDFFPNKPENRHQFSQNKRILLSMISEEIENITTS